MAGPLAFCRRCARPYEVTSMLSVPRRMRVVIDEDLEIMLIESK